MLIPAHNLPGDVQSHGQSPLHMQSGVTLVELLLAITVISILFALAAPNLQTWIQSSQIRTAGESIVSGLQLTRATAVNRNTTTQFVLCGTDSTWNILATSAPANATSCGAAIAGWELVQSHSGQEGTPNAVVATNLAPPAPYTVSYSGLGRVTPIPAVNINFDISNPTGGTCKAAGGVISCMRIVVSAGGQIRLCNPLFSQSTNPQGC